jgi:hypothetical protein
MSNRLHLILINCMIFFFIQRISREEFHRGCAMLNGGLSDDSEQRYLRLMS